MENHLIMKASYPGKTSLNSRKASKNFRVVQVVSRNCNKISSNSLIFPFQIPVINWIAARQIFAAKSPPTISVLKKSLGVHMSESISGHVFPFITRPPGRYRLPTKQTFNPERCVN